MYTVILASITNFMKRILFMVEISRGILLLKKGLRTGEAHDKATIK